MRHAWIAGTSPAMTGSAWKNAQSSRHVCPTLLLAPQLAITLVFFFWPAAQAVWQSLLMQDAFGITRISSGSKTSTLLRRPDYLHSFGVTALFSAGSLTALALDRAAARRAWPTASCAARTRLPDAADLALCGRAGGRRRAVAVHVLSPRSASSRGPAARSGIDWNRLLNGGQALTLVVMAAVWKQISYNFLFFLAGLQSIPKSLIEAAAIDGAGPCAPFWTISSRCCRRPRSSCWWSTSSTPSSTPSASSTRSPAAARPRRPRSWSTRSIYDGSRRRSRRLGGAIGDPDGRS